ncbi:protoheme IX farnesyltransferase [bacterium]|nr:protoheme IX farnesyltransferase [bacterium]
MAPLSQETLLSYSSVGDLLTLLKIRISLAVALTVVVGYWLHSPRFEFAALGPGLGVFLIAGAASTLNQILERRIDALMIRTRTRPLPAGRVRVRSAILLCLFLTACGVLVLQITGGAAALALALFGLAWYDAVYVLLKRKTVFAVVPGAWTGAIPPLVGWSAAGGTLSDPGILTISLFLGVWQIPHFWVLLKRHETDYARVGLPILGSIFTPRQAGLLTFLWIVGAAVSALFLPFSGPAGFRPLWLIPFAAAAVWLVGSGSRLLVRAPDDRDLRAVFRDLNLFGLAVMTMICVARFIN